MGRNSSDRICHPLRHPEGQMSRIAGDLDHPAPRLNLAVGLFDQVGQTEAALLELGLHEFVATRCRLVISSESSTFTDDAVAHLPVWVLIERINPARFSVDQAWSEIVVAKAGAISGRRDEPACDTSAAILARQNQRLMQHLKSGGGVLVVGLNDQAQQQMVAGLLLRLASGVFTDQLRAHRTAAESGNGAHRAKSIVRCAAAARII